MSWQAQKAVTHHSKQTDIKLSRLMHFLADVADENGRIDPAPSQATLADFIGCTNRTIRNYLTTLKESGELTQTRIGSGPGNASAYQITLPLPTDKGGKKVETEAVEQSDLAAKVEILTAKVEMMSEILSTFQQELAELKAERKADIFPPFHQKVEKVEKKGGKGGKERWKGHSTKSAHDLNMIHSDLYKENIYIHPDPEPIAELKTALASVTKTPLWDKTEEEYDQAAYMLMGWDATKESLEKFGLWWANNGYYKGKPALKSLLDEYRNFLSNANGQPSVTTVKQHIPEHLLGVIKR